MFEQLCHLDESSFLHKSFWNMTFPLSMIAVGNTAYRQPGDAHKSSPIEFEHSFVNY